MSDSTRRAIEVMNASLIGRVLELTVSAETVSELLASVLGWSLLNKSQIPISVAYSIEPGVNGKDIHVAFINYIEMRP